MGAYEFPITKMILSIGKKNLNVDNKEIEDIFFFMLHVNIH